MNVELTDGKILLRPWRVDDEEALCEAITESLAELAPWMPWCHEGYQRESTRTFLAAREEAWRNDIDYSFAIMDASTGELLGSLGINQVNRMYRMANLGYWVRTSRTGRGVALRATLLGARFGFEQQQLER